MQALRGIVFTFPSRSLRGFPTLAISKNHYHSSFPTSLNCTVLPRQTVQLISPESSEGPCNLNFQINFLRIQSRSHRDHLHSVIFKEDQLAKQEQTQAAVNKPDMGDPPPKCGNLRKQHEVASDYNPPNWRLSFTTCYPYLRSYCLVTLFITFDGYLYFLFCPADHCTEFPWHLIGPGTLIGGDGGRMSFHPFISAGGPLREANHSTFMEDKAVCEMFEAQNESCSKE